MYDILYGWFVNNKNSWFKNLYVFGKVAYSKESV
jgi:hypothetical protein